MRLSLEPQGTPNNLRVDDLDERILWELVKEARIPNNVLAERVGVSPSTALNRVRALRASGVLRSTHATIDFAALGIHVRAVVAVRLRPQARTEIRNYAQRVIKLANVLSVSFLSGADDFLIHVACTSTSQLRDFVATELSMDHAVASTNTSIVFDHLVGNEHMDLFDSWDVMRQPLG